MEVLGVETCADKKKLSLVRQVDVSPQAHLVVPPLALFG
jgi:hypothetical protein